MKQITICLSLVTASSLLPALSAASSGSVDTLSRGEYLIRIGGCNDCHTPGYTQSGGKLPKGEWLTGSNVGFNGAWGTTYPTNLRLVMQSLSEREWLIHARAPRRPPMPWFNLVDMSDEDLKAIYAFTRSLGAKGVTAPLYSPPGVSVNTPYIDFMPKNMPLTQAKE